MSQIKQGFKVQLAKGIKTNFLETHQKPGRCSAGQTGDQAMRGMPGGGKAIAEISASVLSVE